jgi:class 3 adenylate cyclase/pimeloyl-ACP methyl ester carboxylesterase
MEREVRFCTTSDGVRLAYRVEGDGPDLVFCPEFVGSFDLDHLIGDQMPFWRGLWRGRRVIRFDMRGTGLSQRDPEDVSHTALCADLDAVVRASGAQRFTLWASTLSGPRAIAYAAAHPRQVRRLVLHRTFARSADLMTEEEVRNFADLARLNWPMAAQLFADTDRVVRRDIPDAGLHQAQLYTQSTSGDIVARLLTSGYASTDVSALLPKLRVPTLIVHFRDDQSIFRFSLAERLAEAIPRARLVPFREGIMNYVKGGKADQVLGVINEFIADGAGSEGEASLRRDEPSIQVVLWTDLVNHTEMMRRLGDSRGREVLRDHERITRGVLQQHGGMEVKSMGDGFMAAFRSVTSAVDCAIALQRAIADYSNSTPEPLLVRVGLNAGEPIAEAGDLFGSSVILASRIASQAAGGEILIPEPLRHLLSGKSYVYADRGETVLKGFEDAVRLFEVAWGD